MSQAKVLKDKLQRALDKLRATREELDLQTTLARAEVRTEWTQLERELDLAQEEIGRIDDRSQHAFRDLEQTVRSRLDRVRRGFEQARRAR